MKRYNFFLPEDVVAELKAIADKHDTTYSEIIRKAILEYLKANGRAGSSA